MTNRDKTYKYDKSFLEEHLEVKELSIDNAKLLISPQLQGRVLTSTSQGEGGSSYGWINYDLIQSKKFLPHCNNFGGEDRYWIGPEGGQFSIFFENGKDFDLQNWQTPSPIDTESWKVKGESEQSISLAKEMELTNYAGNHLKLKAEREIIIHNKAKAEEILGTSIDESLSSVAFTSVNKMINTGELEWNQQNGMLSIWILGQFAPSERNTVIIPLETSDGETQINDQYFGKIKEERLKVVDNVVCFKGDGRERGKIGISKNFAKPILGSFDPINSILTLVKYSFDPSKPDYVNSMWEWQDDPFDGDVVNSYNDGPLPDGTIMGPFYELETSSAAAELSKGESITHESTTIHLQGDSEKLNEIAKRLLGFDLKNSF